ncbi:matrixin family metalloprotease [Candidatus Pacearchaeota archaeon]|nr:matrixin family metalloprotease [Candidatus Pacearchaeota archaeon]
MKRKNFEMNKNLVLILFLFILFGCKETHLIETADQSFCSDEKEDLYKQEATDNNLIKFDLCGNLYRYAENDDIKVWIESPDDLIEKFGDQFETYWRQSVIAALGIWQEQFKKYGITINEGEIEEATIFITFEPRNQRGEGKAGNARYFIFKDDEFGHVFGGTWITLSVYWENPVDETEYTNLTYNELRSLSIHEIGHAVGIGDSDISSDMMFGEGYLYQMNLQSRDIRTFKHIYENPVDLPIIRINDFVSSSIL